MNKRMHERRKRKIYKEGRKEGNNSDIKIQIRGINK